MKKKVGIIDVGGGMRGIYGAGVFDYLLEHKIYLPYAIGVSAGSANVASYVSKQKGRNLPFYEEYSFEADYMSLRNFIKKGCYLDLDYIYGTLSNEGGRNPWDFASAMKSSTEMVVVASDANTGKPVYFTKKDYKKNDYGMFIGSSCIPLVCKPCHWQGYDLFDGGFTDAIPIEKAFSDGCTNVIVVLTRPVTSRKKTHNAKQIEKLRKKYPNFVEKAYSAANLYNTQLEYILDNYVASGKAFVIGPSNTHGINTLKKTKESLHALYLDGYNDGAKIAAYLKTIGFKNK